MVNTIYFCNLLVVLHFFLNNYLVPFLQMATPLSAEAPDISLGCKDNWLATKLNATVGNKSSNNASGAHGNELSQRFIQLYITEISQIVYFDWIS